jgi:hypothetical protein
MTTKHSPDEHIIKQTRFVRRNFTSHEDDQLKELVEQYGKSNWKIIAEQMENRTARQCKEHWINKLDPNKNRTIFTSEERQIIFEAHDLFGPQWSRIAQFLDHRSPDDVKNEFRHLSMAFSGFLILSVSINSRSNDKFLSRGFLIEDIELFWNIDGDLVEIIS